MSRQVRIIAATSSSSSANAHPKGPRANWRTSVATATAKANLTRSRVRTGRENMRWNTFDIWLNVSELGSFCQRHQIAFIEVHHRLRLQPLNPLKTAFTLLGNSAARISHFGMPISQDLERSVNTAAL